MTTRFTLGIGLIFSQIFAGVGCSLFGADERTVLMPVETVEIVEVASVGKAFDVTLVGLLTNGCQKFERLESMPVERGVSVTMLAREIIRPGTACTHDIRYVQQTRTFVPQGVGTFLIQVKQPKQHGGDKSWDVRVQ